MSGLQKVIKYCAMAFAIFLSVVIFGAIIAAVTGVATGIAGVHYLTEEKERINLSEQYTEDEIAELGLKNILVDCNARITVQRGQVLSVEALNVTEDYKIRCSNGKLSVLQEKNDFNIRFNWTWGDWEEREKEQVIVTIPEGFVPNQLVIHSGSGKVSVSEVVSGRMELDSGSGSVDITGVTTDVLRMDSGSGRVSLNDVNAMESLLKTGSGSVKGENVSLGRLSVNSGSGAIELIRLVAEDVEVDSGSGAVEFSGKLTGECTFETGSGSASVSIDGEEKEYLVEAECGSGTFRINGKKVEDGSYGNNVKGALIFDAGSGSVNVSFNTPAEE